MDRKWMLVDLTMDYKFDESVPDAFEKGTISACGIFSEEAARREKAGLECFYYDYEQESAGLDKVYGMSSIMTLDRDHVFPDGRIGKKGALHMSITKFDMSDPMNPIFTHMIEDI